MESHRVNSIISGSEAHRYTVHLPCRDTKTEADYSYYLVYSIFGLRVPNYGTYSNILLRN